MKRTKTTYIFLGVYVVGLCLLIYNGDFHTRKESEYRIWLQLTYWAAITLSLVLAFRPRKLVLNEAFIEYLGHQIAIASISKLEVNTDSVFLLSTDSSCEQFVWQAEQFKPEGWIAFREAISALA